MVKCSFFSHIIVYQSFYGAQLTFSYFLLQGKILCFARVGKSLARCLFPKHSEDLVEKIISPECREISLELTQIAAKYHSRSNNRTREISLKKKTANLQYYRNKLFAVVTKTWNDLQPPQKIEQPPRQHYYYFTWTFLVVDCG